MTPHRHFDAEIYIGSLTLVSFVFYTVSMGTEGLLVGGGILFLALWLLLFAEIVQEGTR
jgi:hypothetical protein